GVHLGTAVSRRVADAGEAAALMARLRADPPHVLAGFAVTTTDLLQRHGAHRTDALIFAGGHSDTSVRVVVRPSGTEPKLKCYIEVRLPAGDDLAAARASAQQLRDQLVDEVRAW
ncbi:MAG: phospho-sugar mutase, partial [Mycobacterium sp.]